MQFWWGCCVFCDVTIAVSMTYLVSEDVHYFMNDFTHSVYNISSRGVTQALERPIYSSRVWLALQSRQEQLQVMLFLPCLLCLYLNQRCPPALMAIVNLGLFFGFPHTNYYTVPVLIVAKLYSNTLLVVFNSRMRIMGSREERELSTSPDLTSRLAVNFQLRGPTFARLPSVYLDDSKTIGREKNVWRDASNNPDSQVSSCIQWSSDPHKLSVALTRMICI